MCVIDKDSDVQFRYVKHTSVIWTILTQPPTHPKQNGRHFTDDIFKCICVNEHFHILIKIALTLVTDYPNGSDKVLVPNRWQAIIWTNGDPIHWRIYVALGGDELHSISKGLLLMRFHQKQYNIKDAAYIYWHVLIKFQLVILITNDAKVRGVTPIRFWREWVLKEYFFYLMWVNAWNPLIYACFGWRKKFTIKM